MPTPSGAQQTIGAIGQGLGGLGGLLQAFGIGENPQEWIQNALVGLYNRAQQGDEMARGLYEQFAGPSRQNSVNTTDALQRPMIDLAPYLMQWGQDDKNNVDPTIQNYQSQFGGMANQANQGLQGLLSGFQQTGDTARQGFQSGGWTPQYQSTYDTLAPFLAGRGSNSQMELDNTGANLLGQRGQTALTQALSDRGIDASNNKGMNSTLDSAQGMALGTLAQQGFNPTLNKLTDKGLSTMDAALSRALGTPLMSAEKAGDWAREDSYNQSAAAREKFYDSISGLGGGPATLGSGLQNQKKMDFADAAAQNAASASRDAFLKQQQLQLGDRSNAASLVGVGGQLAGQGANIAAGREGQAYSAIPGTQNAATSQMSALLQAALGGGNLENSRMQTGGQLSQDFVNSIMQGLGQQNTAMGNQNQYALGLGNLGNQSSSQMATLFNSMFGNSNQAAQTGLQASGQSINGQQNATQGLSNSWNNISNAFNQSNNNLTNLAGQALNYAGQNVNLMGVPFAGMANNFTGTGFSQGLINAGAAMQPRR